MADPVKATAELSEFDKFVKEQLAKADSRPKRPPGWPAGDMPEPVMVGGKPVSVDIDMQDGKKPKKHLLFHDPKAADQVRLMRPSEAYARYENLRSRYTAGDITLSDTPVWFNGEGEIAEFPAKQVWVETADENSLKVVENPDEAEKPQEIWIKNDAGLKPGNEVKDEHRFSPPEGYRYEFYYSKPEDNPENEKILKAGEEWTERVGRTEGEDAERGFSAADARASTLARIGERKVATPQTVVRAAAPAPAAEVRKPEPAAPKPGNENGLRHGVDIPQEDIDQKAVERTIGATRAPPRGAAQGPVDLHKEKLLAENLNGDPVKANWEVHATAQNVLKYMRNSFESPRIPRLSDQEFEKVMDSFKGHGAYGTILWLAREEFEKGARPTSKITETARDDLSSEVERIGNGGRQVMESRQPRPAVQAAPAPAPAAEVKKPAPVKPAPPERASSGTTSASPKDTSQKVSASPSPPPMRQEFERCAPGQRCTPQAELDKLREANRIKDPLVVDAKSLPKDPVQAAREVHMTANRVVEYMRDSYKPGSKTPPLTDQHFKEITDSFRGRGGYGKILEEAREQFKRGREHNQPTASVTSAAKDRLSNEARNIENRMEQQAGPVLGYDAKTKEKNVVTVDLGNNQVYALWKGPGGKLMLLNAEEVIGVAAQMHGSEAPEGAAAQGDYMKRHQPIIKAYEELTHILQKDKTSEGKPFKADDESQKNKTKEKALEDLEKKYGQDAQAKPPGPQSSVQVHQTMRPT